MTKWCRKMTFLKRGDAFGAFSGVILCSNCRFELEWSESEPVDRPREFRKSLHCSTVYLTFAVTEKFISARKA